MEAIKLYEETLIEEAYTHDKNPLGSLIISDISYIGPKRMKDTAYVHVCLCTCVHLYACYLSQEKYPYLYFEQSSMIGSGQQCCWYKILILNAEEHH